LLLFVTFLIACKFCKLLFTVERGKVCYFLLLFVTACNFDKLLFTIEKGQGLYSIHCATGERVYLDFFPFLFFTIEGEGVKVNVFFFPRYMKRWKEEGGKGLI